MQGYAALEEAFGRVAILGEINSLLHWDAATCMPVGAAKRRGEQIAATQLLMRDILTDESVSQWLEDAGQESHLTDWQSANLREMRRIVAHSAAVPADLLAAVSKAASHCETVWRQARLDDDFASVLEPFSQLLDLTRQSAQAKVAVFGGSAYEALMDYWEPGIKEETIDRIFSDLESFLADFIPEVMEAQKRRPDSLAPTGPFPVDGQRRLARHLMRLAGFDFDRGRLDKSAHPFCGGGGDDVRMTVRYDEHDYTQAIMATLHETGHALYELGLPQAWQQQPVGSARGMSIHESQSLSVEMQACRSRAFIEFLAPLVQETFGGKGSAWSAESLYHMITRVRPSPIRVDADEVTYPVHVILRYRLETALLSGDLQPVDLPSAWREGMRDLLDYVPLNDREGCLQDIHWYEGIWGYFPTYALGAMSAAQLFQAACQDRPELMHRLGQGDFTPLTAWMGENIHAWGSFYETGELLCRATGRPLDAGAYKTHLQARYLHEG